MTTEKETVQKGFQRRYMLLAFSVIGDFGATLAIPAVLGAIIGSRLDTRYGTEPWLLIICLVMTASFSAFVVKRRAEQYGKKYQALVDEEKKDMDKFKIG